MATAQPILNELLDPLGECLTPEVAQRIVRLRAPESVQTRVEELAAKSTENRLSKQERHEYDALVSVGNFIAILQAKARRLLRDRPTS